MEAVKNNPGQPILYASTTKGTMKLEYDGHHFRYSFRKGKYTIFQCCYKESMQECNVRVVTDQKLVYPLDGEHVHFIQATDKSVTSVKFSPGVDTEAENTNEVENATAEEEQTTTVELQDVVLEESTTPVYIENIVTQPKKMNVKLEKGVNQDQMEFTSETPATAATEDPNEFREKIKKRLQKALLGKKK
ncbi:pre-mod(mdg4)-T [Musca autumnalis]|uniref:pre-mod(mdg4)-T n=1 Tax=Musca autumnalis TaxID=221902 RepID=UPI003CFB9704